MAQIRKTLTIAGSDTSGGAGIQADLKTFEEYGTYGMSVLTVIVTMDPDQGWSHGVHPLDGALQRAQLKTVLAGGKIDAMKTGMLPNVDSVHVALEAIASGGIDNVVIDPVMVCKGEAEVLNPENAEALRTLLVPRATVTTPNLFEAGVLSGLGTPKTIDEMKEAARRIHDLGTRHVVIKGGKGIEAERAIDLYFDGNAFDVLATPKLETSHNHGAGCTFAAAVTAALAQGLSVRDAVHSAKAFAFEAIRGGFAFNRFVGPVFHAAQRLGQTKA